MAWELATFGQSLLDADGQAVQALAAEEEALAGVEVEVVASGEAVRITHVLDAVVVVSCLDFPGEERPLHEQEALIDLAGPGAPRTPFSGKTNVVLSFKAVPGRGNEEIEAAARRVALAAAERLAAPTLDAEPDEVERFELGPADETVPAVVALVQLSDLGPLYYQYVYGVPAGDAELPRPVDPAEVLDGAITCGEYHWAALRNPTIFFQRNELIRALYRRHGEQLRF